MRKILFSLYVALFFSSLASAQEKETAANIKNILESNTCTWAFVDIPFQRAIDFISDTNKINIVVDPKVSKRFETEKTKVSLQVTNVKLKDALNLLLDMHKLRYTVYSGILLITDIDSDIGKSQAKTVFHDINMISMAEPPVPILARRLQDGIWLPYSLEEESQIKIRSRQNDYEDDNYHFGCLKITELIKYSIAKDTWAEGNYSIQEIGNHGLIVLHTPDVQEQISLFLKELSSFCSSPIPIEIWCFEIDNSTLISSKLYCSPTVDEKTMTILEDAAKAGNGQVIFHTKFNAHNRTLVPLINSSKAGQKSLIAICPTLYPNKEVLIEMASIISEPCEYQDTSVEKTAFQNFGSVFLMPSGKISTIALSPLCDGRSLIMLMRVSPEQWEPTVKSPEKNISSEEQKILRKLREKKISLNFKGTPLGEVLSFLSNATDINMLVAPDVYKKIKDEETLAVNLTCTNLNCESILNLILEMKNLTYRIDCGVLIVTTYSNVPNNIPALRLYDIRDVRLNPCYDDFFSTGKKEYCSSSEGIIFEESPRFSISPYVTGDEEALFPLIKDNIAKASWEESDVSLDIFRGILVIRHTPYVQQEVFGFIDYLRNNYRKNHRMISIWAYLAPKDKTPETMVLAALSNRQKVCVKSGVVYMGNTQKDKEKRKEEVDYLDTQINMQDQIEKREALSISFTPLLKEDGIELSLEFNSWGVCGFEHSLTVLVPIGKTVPVATIPGDKEEKTLFVGAFTMK